MIKNKLTKLSPVINFRKMARPKPKRRAYVRRARLLAAAKALGRNYSHLRRVVCGERSSRSLMNRFRAWKRQQRNAPSPKTENPNSP